MQRKLSERIGFTFPLRSLQKRKQHCNLCGHVFRPHSAFERYCRHCKEDEELLRYSDWLPELDETLTARISA